MRYARGRHLSVLFFAVYLIASGPTLGAPPNIVFIMTDDQAAWALGASGNRDAWTPNIDRLALEGVRLTQCFTTTPVCSPARAGFLTSRYSSEVDIPDFIRSRTRGLDPSFPAWPRVLAEKGYATGLVGKWHLGQPERSSPERFGYQEFVGFRGAGRTSADPEIEVEGKVQETRGYTADILTDHAIDFLGRKAPGPFLLSVHFFAPHASVIHRTEDGDRTWRPLHPLDWRRFENSDPEIPHADHPDLDLPRARRMMREYLASVAAADRNIGRLFSTIDSLGVRDNTIVIVTSDHGYNLGHHGLWHKGNGYWLLKTRRDSRPNLFDHSLRVPAIVRWPGVLPPGGRVDDMVTQLDWFPTVLRMAGIEAAEIEGVHGRDILPLLRGEKPRRWNQELFCQYSMRETHDERGAVLRAYRTPEWKLVRDFKNPKKDELYNLKEDPEERRNLIHSEEPEPRARRRELEEKLLRFMHAIDDPALGDAEPCAPREGRGPFEPVPANRVRLGDGFWAERLETNRRVTIPHSLRQCERTRRIQNFSVAAGLAEGEHAGHHFNDSDVYKLIEGASHALMAAADPALERSLDAIIEKIAAAQEADGYLYTGRSIDPERPAKMAGERRWSLLRYSHELYNVGHLYEAAAAHYRATGKRNLLDVAVKNADLLTATFGTDRKRDVPGHEEIEIGLVKLHAVTADAKYLKLAEFFVEERGHHEARESYKDFRQDHVPVTRQSEAVGHAVSGAYLYAAMADLAVRAGKATYLDAVDRIWSDIVSRKLYITGNNAARGERFSRPFELPNLKGFNETCAAIGNALLNHRLFLIHGDAKYVDVLERTLYNGVLAGLSLGGDRFFYSNPLASDGKYRFNGVDVPADEFARTRVPWFICACCPTNLVRILPQVPGFAYAQCDDAVFVNLFMASTVSLSPGGQRLRLKQETRYPWEGKVTLTFESERPALFTLFLRIPGWARQEPVPGGLYRYLEKRSKGPSLRCNGKPLSLELERGFARIRRTFKNGDRLELDLPMPVRRVLCDERVVANRGRVALERGPIVFCAEWPDNEGRVSRLIVPDRADLKTEYREDLFNGVSVIRGQILTRVDDGADSERKPHELIALPYYAWSNRGEGEMAVWLAREPGAPDSSRARVPK